MACRDKDLATVRKLVEDPISGFEPLEFNGASLFDAIEADAPEIAAYLIDESPKYSGKKFDLTHLGFNPEPDLLPGFEGSVFQLIEGEDFLSAGWEFFAKRCTVDMEYFSALRRRELNYAAVYSYGVDPAMYRNTAELVVALENLQPSTKTLVVDVLLSKLGADDTLEIRKQYLLSKVCRDTIISGLFTTVTELEGLRTQAEKSALSPTAAKLCVLEAIATYQRKQPTATRRSYCPHVDLLRKLRKCF